MSDAIIKDLPPQPAQVKTRDTSLVSLKGVKAQYGTEQAPASDVLSKHLENRKAWRGSNFESLLDEAASTMSERKASQWIQAHPTSTPEETGREMGTFAWRYSL